MYPETPQLQAPRRAPGVAGTAARPRLVPRPHPFLCREKCCVHPVKMMKQMMKSMMNQ
jgi:hypothetical protein